MGVRCFAIRRPSFCLHLQPPPIPPLSRQLSYTGRQPQNGFIQYVTTLYDEVEEELTYSSAFVTGNANKLKEVKAILAAGDSGIEVTSEAVDGEHLKHCI